MQDLYVSAQEIEEVIKHMIIDDLVERASDKIRLYADEILEKENLQDISLRQIKDVVEKASERGIDWETKREFENKIKMLIQDGAEQYINEPDTKAALLLFGQEQAKEIVNTDKVVVDIRINVRLEGE